MTEEQTKCFRYDKDEDELNIPVLIGGVWQGQCSLFTGHVGALPDGTSWIPCAA